MLSRARRRVLLALVPLALVPLLVAATHGSRRLTTVSCGQTITASTTLSADLGPCGSNGVFIGADHVTLNLNGHSIIGSGGFVGVSSSNTGVVVENGSVLHFGTDVFLHGDSSRVMNLHVSAASGFGIDVSGHNDVISGNRAFTNGGSGIAGDGAGSQYTNNILQGNSTEGLNVSNAALISGNKALNNGTFGINALDTLGAPMVVTNNITNGNQNHGMVAGTSVDPTVITLSGNKAYFNANLGISGQPGVTDGGNNKADENGTAAQCTSIVCS
jgi:hypothetical protein